MCDFRPLGALSTGARPGPDQRRPEVQLLCYDVHLWVILRFVGESIQERRYE